MSGDVSDTEIARAQALGRLAARQQRQVNTCPYDRTQRVLRARWVLAYAGAGGRVGVEGGPARRAVAKAQAWWSGGAGDSDAA